MAVTVTAALVDDASGWSNTPPAGHAGWNNTAGDTDWVPDVAYYKKVLLTCEGDAGEVKSVVNWEIFDARVYLIDTAANLEAKDDAAAGGQVLGLASDTMDLYAWNGSDDWVLVGPSQGDATGGAVSTLRANGPRVVVDLPFYAKWDVADQEEADFVAFAFLPGSFGVPAGSDTVSVSNPDVAVLA